MEIKIVQKKWNLILNRYDIYIDDVLEYKSQTKLFNLKETIDIYSLGERKVISVKKDNDFSNLMNYTLEFQNGYTKIRSKSFIEFSIKNSKGSLNFYEQKSGNLIGVFQNDDQVGFIKREIKKVINQDKYKIVFDKNKVDSLSLIGFAIAYDMENHNDSSFGNTWDYGMQVDKPIKEVDINWSPEK
ncbi:hypothetical protein [Aquimarina latercula]|uniref:hypothetical protein n=1 Tax=Aquimarina latercula TaxID=987 RepID=UPI000420D835|nr:hypothetical protein [Aquimarina latercula]